MRAMVTCLDTLSCYEEVQIRGLSYLIYGQNLSFSHATMWSPRELAELFPFFEKSIPLRHLKITFLKLPLPLWAMLEFAKRLVSSKIRERIEMKNSLESFDSDLLPKDLNKDGNYGISDLSEDWIQVIYQKQEELEWISKIEIRPKETSTEIQKSRNKRKFLIF